MVISSLGEKATRPLVCFTSSCGLEANRSLPAVSEADQQQIERLGDKVVLRTDRGDSSLQVPA